MDEDLRNALNKMPSRVKYYLLEWKNNNMEDYISKFGELRLNDLTVGQIQWLFFYATKKDVDSIKLMNKSKKSEQDTTILKFHKE